VEGLCPGRGGARRPREAATGARPRSLPDTPRPAGCAGSASPPLPAFPFSPRETVLLAQLEPRLVQRVLRHGERGLPERIRGGTGGGYTAGAPGERVGGAPPDPGQSSGGAGMGLARRSPMMARGRPVGDAFREKIARAARDSPDRPWSCVLCGN
jgi:hypothetical protein